MSKPVIAIVATFRDDPAAPGQREIAYVGRPYIDRVIEAGGVPVVVPPGVSAEDIVPLVDGWLIMGGGDLDPRIYGEQPHPEAKLERPERTVLEQALLQRLAPSVPVLGICYGCQFLNVQRGGSLHQHVPDVVGHEEHSSRDLHEARISEGTLTEALVGAGSVVGHSSHHQSIREVGSGLRVTALAEDGTIEGVEDDGGRWLVGVQWHPERTPNDEATRQLFKAFVAEAARQREDRDACGTW